MQTVPLQQTQTQTQCRQIKQAQSRPLNHLSRSLHLLSRSRWRQNRLLSNKLNRLNLLTLFLPLILLNLNRSRRYRSRQQ